MKVIAAKFSQITSLLSLLLAAAGAFSLSLMAFLVGVLLWVVSRQIAAPDIPISTPGAQYWSRNLIFRVVSVFIGGFCFGGLLAVGGIDLQLGGFNGSLFGCAMLALLVLAFRRVLPEFMEASWTLYSTSDRAGEPQGLDVHWSRFIVLAAASALFLSATLAGTALLSSSSLIRVALAG